MINGRDARPGGSGATARHASPRQTRVAAFASSGTTKLGLLIGFPVAVVAATDDLLRHAEWLSSEWYAAGTPSADWVLPIDMLDWDFRDYRHLPFEEQSFGERPLPPGIALQDGALVVDLPPGVAPPPFAASFRKRLAALRYDEVARRPSQVALRRGSKRPLEAPPRYGCFGGDVTRPYAIRDLVALGSRRAARFATIAAATLAELAAAPAAPGVPSFHGASHDQP